MVQDHVTLGIHAFFRACFLEVEAPNRRKPLIEDLPDGWGSHVSFARIMAFGPQEETQRTTGIVLLEAHGNEVVSTMFRRGLPTIRPYGLDGPQCAFCATTNNVKYVVKRSQVTFKCTCGATSKGHQPSGVYSVPVVNIPRSHYIVAFPISYSKFMLEWTLNGEKRQRPWVHSVL